MTTFERQQRPLDIIRKTLGLCVPEFALTQMRGSAIVNGQRLSNPPFVILDQITYRFTDF